MASIRGWAVYYSTEEYIPCLCAPVLEKGVDLRCWEPLSIIGGGSNRLRQLQAPCARAQHPVTPEERSGTHSDHATNMDLLPYLA